MIRWDEDGWEVDGLPLLAVSSLAGTAVGFGVGENWSSTALGFGIGLTVPLLALLGLFLRDQLSGPERKF